MRTKHFHRVPSAGPHIYSLKSQYGKVSSLWENSTETQEYLSQVIHSGDKLLVESGSTIILALYDKNFPTNTTTFDWLKYDGLQGLPAYRHAVRDGYFDWIELISENIAKDAPLAKIHKEVAANMDTNYKLVYSNNYGQIYKKTY